MTVNGSPDITDLKIQVLFDLSLAIPVVKLTNQSTGPHLGNVDLVFELYGPNSQPIHVGNFTTPDAAGNFATYTFAELFPSMGNSIEWSGNPYRLVIKGKDSEANEFQFSPEQNAEVCQPKGNSNVGKNFGEARLDISTDCNKAELYLKDITNYYYRGLAPIFVSKKIIVIPPADADYGAPTPVEYNDFSYVIHPITVVGSGYTAVVQTVADFDFGNNVFVRIKFVATETFPVNCNYDLCPLISEWDKWITDAMQKCDPSLNDKMLIANSKLVNILFAYNKPACGMNVGKMIEDLIEFAGFKCDCTCKNIGLNSNGSTTGGLNFQFTTCGDLTASAVVTGSNVALTIRDKTYTFTVNPDSTTAFSFTPTVNGCTRNIQLNVDMNILATDMLTFIKTKPALVNLFNSIFNQDLGNVKLLVDGKCLLSTLSCTYDMTLVDVCNPADENILFLQKIRINGVDYVLNFGFVLTDLAPLIAALNALGKGVFNASVTSAMSVYTLHITSATNPNDIEQVSLTGTCGTGFAPDDIRLMAIGKNCTTSVQYSASQIVQAIINRICSMLTTQVYTSADITYCTPTFDVDGKIVTKTILAGSTTQSALTTLAQNQCDIIAVMLASRAVSCLALKAIYVQQATKTLKPTDLIHMEKNGECAGVTQDELAVALFSIMSKLPAFCAAVVKCAIPGCSPVLNFEVEKIDDES